MNTIIMRVWDEAQGWMHEVRQYDNESITVVARSKFRDELEEEYPQAANTKHVECVTNCYDETFGD